MRAARGRSSMETRVFLRQSASPKPLGPFAAAFIEETEEEDADVPETLGGNIEDEEET